MANWNVSFMRAYVTPPKPFHSSDCSPRVKCSADATTGRISFLHLCTSLIISPHTIHQQEMPDEVKPKKSPLTLPNFQNIFQEYWGEDTEKSLTNSSVLKFAFFTSVCMTLSIIRRHKLGEWTNALFIIWINRRIRYDTCSSCLSNPWQ